MTMKTTILLLGILLSSLAQAEVISLNVNNLGGESGQLALAIFNDPDAFPDRAASAIHTQFVPLNSGMNQVEVNINLKPGTYAIAAYLDKNKNRQLDTNMVGAPKERFGFSNNPSIRFSAPNFNECSFDVNEKTKRLQINLIKFF
jgi:uncharacterized protein (DUF2141 family)